MQNVKVESGLFVSSEFCRSLCLYVRSKLALSVEEDTLNAFGTEHFCCCVTLPRLVHKHIHEIA